MNFTPDDPCKYTMYGDGDTPWMRAMAKDILELLDTVYPRHPWGVKVYGDELGGGYILFHRDFPYNWGENQKEAHLLGSASAFRADVLMRAGTLLERCGLARKAWNEDPIKRMEGVPEKWQPEPIIPKIDVEKLVDAGKSFVRDTQMPQVAVILEEEKKNGH